jgi:dihydroorotate dehydrogenase electron transfer subunit
MVSTAVQERASVVEQVRLARDTYRLRLACPQLARQIVPGQFFMVRPAGGTDPLLGRPFALYDVYPDQNGRPAGVDVVYHVIGKVTGLMPHWSPGDPVELWGPLGNGFPVAAGGHLVCVGGGIGYTPFLAVAREAAGQRRYGNPPRGSDRPGTRVTLCYGVRTAAIRADLADFSGISDVTTRIATDDGTEGHHGFVTDLLSQMLESPADRPAAVYCCGPEPMMRATARLCEAQHVPCWLSLETSMACGFGACFSCVTKVHVPDETGWDYRRTCIEGPVFPSRSLLLD